MINTKEINFILEHLKKRLDIKKDEDYINELFDSRREVILDYLSTINPIKQYEDETMKLDEKINEKFKKPEIFIEYVTEYEMLLNNEDIKCQEILYKQGINDGIKIVENKIDKIEEYKTLKQETQNEEIENAINKRVENIMKRINESEFMKKSKERLLKFEETVDDSIRYEILIKEYKKLIFDNKIAIERLIYLTGVYDGISILIEGRKNINIRELLQNAEEI